MARNNEPRTQRERLDTRRGLQAAARPQATYDNARPAYAERPYGAGNEMESLARSLSQFDRSLGGFLEQRLDKQIEEGVAQGMVLFSENPDDNKNMKDWKALTESDPDKYAALNPYVKKGYEQARLKSLGLDYEKSLNDAFIESGLNNERDMDKVNAFFTEFDKSFREQAGLDKYEDKITLAQNYTALTAAAKDGLYKRHTAALMEQNESLLGQQHLDVAVKALENSFDPNVNGKTRFLGDPHQEETNLALMASTIMNEVQQATAKGYRNAKAPELAAAMVFTAAEKMESTKVLKVLDSITINGVALSNMPGVAAQRERLEQAELEKRLADTRWGWAQEEHRLKQEERSLPSVMLQFMQSGAPATVENLKQAGMPDRLILPAMTLANAYQEGQTKAVNTNPNTLEERARLLTKAKMGIMHYNEVLNAFRTYGPTEGEQILQAYIDADKDENKALASAMKEGAGKLFSLFSRMPKDDALSFMEMDQNQQDSLNQFQRNGLEAMTVFTDRLQVAYNQALLENKGSPLSAVQLTSLSYTVQAEVTKELQGRFAPMEETPTVPPAQAPAAPAAPAKPAPVKPQQGATFTLSPEMRESMEQLFKLKPETAKYREMFENDPTALQDFMGQFTATQQGGE